MYGSFLRLLAILILFLFADFEIFAAGTDSIVEKEKQLAGLPGDTTKVNLLLDLGRYYCSGLIMFPMNRQSG